MSRPAPPLAAPPRAAPADKPGRSLWRWLGMQLASFAWLLALVLGLGIVVAIVRRQLHYRSFLTGLGILVLGTAALAALLYLDPLSLGARRDEALWPGVLVIATLAGFGVGKVGRRVGFFESYLAVLLTAALYAVHLAKGWHVLLGFGGTDVLSAWDLASMRAPGVAYLGEMWDRVLALATLAALLLAVFGGSIAFLFFSDEGRLDAGFGLEWFVGRRHLQREGRGIVSATALVAVVGIGLGVGALVAVTAVMSGYQEEIRERILSTNAHLILQKYGLDFTEHDEIADKVLALDGVIAASPFVFNEAMLSDGERAFGISVKGVRPQTAPAVTGIEQNLCAPAGGRCVPFSPGERRGLLEEWLAPADGVPAILLGSELYKRLGLPVGSSVLLTTPIGITAARGNAPRRVAARITGVFHSGMHEFDVRLAYMDLAATQQLFGLGGNVTGIEFRVREPESVDLTARAAMRAVGRYPYRTLDWRELNAGIFTALNLQKILMFLILTFIVVVAAFNIASTLFMAVGERAHEIAVLKSMGARDASIMKIFVMQGWVVGGLGTVSGLALGLAVAALIAEVPITIAADVYMVDTLTVRVWPLEVFLVVAATLVISHLATLHPALKAARQRPVDVMRYE